MKPLQCSYTLHAHQCSVYALNFFGETSKILGIGLEIWTRHPILVGIQPIGMNSPSLRRTDLAEDFQLCSLCWQR